MENLFLLEYIKTIRKVNEQFETRFAVKFCQRQTFCQLFDLN